MSAWHELKKRRDQASNVDDRGGKLRCCGAIIYTGNIVTDRVWLEDVIRLVITDDSTPVDDDRTSSGYGNRGVIYYLHQYTLPGILRNTGRILTG